MSRILIHEPVAFHDQCSAAIAARTLDVVVCRNREALVTALGDRRPDVLVYVLEDLGADLGLLRRLRGVAPTLPIIVIGGPTDLAARRTIQELKPTYYGVLPLDEHELNEAVRGAIERCAPRD